MSQIAQSRDIILREEEFLPLLAQAADPMGSLVASLAQDASPLTAPGPLLRLGNAADLVETFLDDFGARENRTFVTFGELVASIRGLCRVRGVALYLLSRLPRYQTLRDADELLADLRSSDEGLGAGLSSLCGGLLEEASALGFSWVPGPMPAGDPPAARRLLPRNLDADTAVDERQHIAELGSRFMAVLKASRQLDLSRRREAAELTSFVAMHATEERCRWYESAVHNIQSMYDTYVLRTAVEAEHPWLRHLRGHVSVARHLLEMATGLVHFYERHETDIRHEAARERISDLVSKEQVLEIAVNTCLREAYLYVEGCAEVAERIIETFASKQTVELEMPEDVSLHARPLALIVQIARHYRTPLEISLEGESCSALSLMGLIMLAGRHPKPTSVVACGDTRALEDLKLLFEDGLGERGTLPEPLAYLRTSS